jgi:YVTN family beta-propeller protein
MRAAPCWLVLVVLLGGVSGLAAQENPSGTILVANMDDDSVWLIDAGSGERRATIETHIAPHEIAVSTDGRVAAVTNYGDERGPGNLVQFVDVAAGVVTHEITIEGYERLHGAAFLGGDSLLALTSERTGEILVVSTENGAIRRRMSTGGRASHMLALGGDWIYAANITDGTVSRVDPGGATPASVWPAGTRTEGVAATPDGSEGWTGSMDAGTVVGVLGATGEVIARVEGLSVPYRLAVTPDGETVVVSDPEAGALVLIDRSEGSIAASIDIDAAAEVTGLGSAASPQGFALSPDGAWAFVSANAIARVALVDLVSRRVVRFVRAGTAPDGIAFSPVGPN